MPLRARPADEADPCPCASPPSEGFRQATQLGALAVASDDCTERTTNLRVTKPSQAASGPQRPWPARRITTKCQSGCGPTSRLTLWLWRRLQRLGPARGALAGLRRSAKGAPTPSEGRRTAGATTARAGASKEAFGKCTHNQSDILVVAAMAAASTRGEGTGEFAAVNWTEPGLEIEARFSDSDASEDESEEDESEEETTTSIVAEDARTHGAGEGGGEHRRSNENDDCAHRLISEQLRSSLGAFRTRGPRPAAEQQQYDQLLRAVAHPQLVAEPGLLAATSRVIGVATPAIKGAAAANAAAADPRLSMGSVHRGRGRKHPNEHDKAIWDMIHQNRHVTEVGPGWVLGANMFSKARGTAAQHSPTARAPSRSRHTDPSTGVLRLRALARRAGQEQQAHVLKKAAQRMGPVRAPPARLHQNGAGQGRAQFGADDALRRRAPGLPPDLPARPRKRLPLCVHLPGVGLVISCAHVRPRVRPAAGIRGQQERNCVCVRCYGFGAARRAFGRTLRLLRRKRECSDSCCAELWAALGTRTRDFLTFCSCGDTAECPDLPSSLRLDCFLDAEQVQTTQIQPCVACGLSQQPEGSGLTRKLPACGCLDEGLLGDTSVTWSKRTTVALPTKRSKGKPLLKVRVPEGMRSGRSPCSVAGLLDPVGRASPARRHGSLAGRVHRPHRHRGGAVAVHPHQRARDGRALF